MTAPQTYVLNPRGEGITTRNLTTMSANVVHGVASALHGRERAGWLDAQTVGGRGSTMLASIVFGGAR